MLKFQVLGGDTLVRWLGNILDWLDDLTTPLSESVDLIEEKSKQNFDKEQSSTEWKWNDLSPSTQRARSHRRWYYKQQPRNPGILRWTGRLQESIRKTVLMRMASIERTAPYAKYHQIWGGKIPKRKFIELDPATKTEIVRKFQSHVNDIVGMRNINKRKSK